MKLLAEIRDSNIFPHTQDQDPVFFSERQTARAVLLNSLGQVGMLYVGEYAHHKLPGGGIEDGETAEDALKRELLEEMGCGVEILGEVGKIIEYKNNQRRRQTSLCYLAKQEGEMVAPTFTKNELENNYQAVWVDDIDSAIKLVTDDDPTNYSRKFIRARELIFLNAAKSLLE